VLGGPCLKANWGTWLDPRNHATNDVLALVAPPLDGSMEMYAVSTAVKVRNDGLEVLQPLEVS
jgi:putative SOS response-associated peptidase YedK